jgi:hypothetical protein
VEVGHGLVGDGTLTVDVLALAAIAAWLLAFGWCAAVTRWPARQARTVDPGLGLASAKPALVNLAVTQCRLNGAGDRPGPVRAAGPVRCQGAGRWPWDAV